MNRIAYICADPGVPVFGCKGASVHTQEVLRAMRRLGGTIELFTPRDDGAAADDLRSLPLHALPEPCKGSSAEKECAALATNQTLEQALAVHGPFDLIYERYSLWSYAGMEFARTHGIPGVLEVNAPLIDEHALHRGLVNRRGAENVAHRVFESAAVIACVSNEVAKWVRSHRQWDSQGAASAEPRQCLHDSLDTKIHVVPNAVNPFRFGQHVKPLLPAIDDSFVVGFVGTLKPWHGLPILADAFTELYHLDPDARLLIVGDGPERDSFESTLRERGVRDVVHFTGSVAPEEVPGWLASMHAAVAPYPAMSDFYFSPLKLFEYLAAGVPTVASRIGQITEILRDGETALLVSPGDAPALAAALIRLHRDKTLRAQLASNGRRTIERHHTWDATVKRLFALTACFHDAAEIHS
jgi:glycosyltransferase involved in cell wall biosynthesis